MLNSAYSGLQSNLGSEANPANNNPYNTPGFSAALGTMNQDITNQVNSEYAAAGRDPSGAGSFAQSLGRGLSQGEGSLIQSQYNQNVSNQENAANTLYGAGNTTASNITGQQQVPLTDAATAIGLAPSAATNYTAPGTTQLGAADAAYSLPWTNLSSLLTPATQIASLGGQSTGTSTGTVTQDQSTLSNILGGLSGGVGLLSLLKPTTTPSDKRIKTDIAQIGKLNDGQTVHRFRYKGDPTMRIGLLAQDVAKTEPEAVHNIGGVLTVDQKQATEKAARLGRAR